MPIDRAGYRSGTVMHVNVRKDICFPFQALVCVHLCSRTRDALGSVLKNRSPFITVTFLPLAKAGI